MPYQSGPFTCFDDSDEDAVKAWWDALDAEGRTNNVDVYGTSGRTWYERDFLLDYAAIILLNNGEMLEDVWEAYGSMHQEGN